MNILINNIKFNYETVFLTAGMERENTKNILRGYTIEFIINDLIESKINIPSDKIMAFEEIHDYIQNQISIEKV
jgi:hypothetical protein